LSSQLQLAEQQAHWLRRVLENRHQDGPRDALSIPADIQWALIARGYIRLRQGANQITLDGIRALARSRPASEPAQVDAHEAVELSIKERHWLLSISDGPLTKAAAERNVPKRMRQILIEKGLICWRTGFLDVTLLEVTPLGEREVRRLKGKSA
jgi:hypothetical protein